MGSFRLMCRLVFTYCGQGLRAMANGYGKWTECLIIIIIIIIIILFSFMQDIYTYIPETNCVP